MRTTVEVGMVTMALTFRELVPVIASDVIDVFPVTGVLEATEIVTKEEPTVNEYPFEVKSLFRSI